MRAAALAVGLAICAATVAAQPAHPLDPLDAAEITTALVAVARSGRATPDTRAAVVALAEPDKAALLAWRPGEPFGRRAYVALRVAGRTVEAEVDLADGALVRWAEVPGAQTPIRSDEWASAQALLKADPRWGAAMRRRGLDPALIFCDALSAGYFGRPEDDGRRLLKMPCFEVGGARVNIYARPIEGVLATVDLDAGAVLDVTDVGVAATGGTATGGAHDVAVSQIAAPPPGPPPPGLMIDGRSISWEGWSFHRGFDPRFGVVISLLARHEQGRRRMVLHQGHVSEVFVPYMDDDPAWAFRTYLDGGEYGLGVLASPLVAGIDCPADALFFDEPLSGPVGGVNLRERAVCVFVRGTGAPMWRHHEGLTGAHAGRPATELVIRTIPSVAHYDYVTDWVLTPGGEIRVAIGATGIDAVKSVADPAHGENGATVAPALVAIHHDHFFSVRLDLDVDGAANRLIRVTAEPETLPPGQTRRSLWRPRSKAVAQEGALNARPGREFWRLENAGAAGAPGYEIEVAGPTSLLSADDWPAKRAAFAATELWVTRARPGERHAAGPFPNQSPGGDGLARYADGEAILDADLALWATVGFRHVARPEDWPVLGVVWRGVTLRPWGFFSRNPSVAAPPR